MLSDYFSEINDHGTVVPVKDLAAYPRSEQAVMSAKNWFNYTKATTENNGVTFTNSNNQSCTLSGQATADQAAIEMGTLTVDKDTEFIFNGASSSNNAKIHMYVFDSTTGARPYTDSSKTTIQNNNCFGTGANKEIPFFAEAGHVIKVYARVQTTGTSVPNNTVFWPMIRLGSDPDPTFAPYAKTNKELTDAVADTGWKEVETDSSNVSSGSVRYRVKAGVCYVAIEGVAFANSGNNQAVANGLPKPTRLTAGMSIASSSTDAPTNNGFFVNLNSSILSCHVGKATISNYLTLVYPID